MTVIPFLCWQRAWTVRTLLLTLFFAAYAVPNVHAQRATPSVGTRTVLIDGIGDAENAAFSDDGRLFVTGGENIYELEQRGTGFVATPLFDGTCNFTGVVVRDGTLYANCLAGTALGDLKPRLVAGSLTRPTSVRVIHHYAQTAFPNGMAFDPQGRLLVTDFSPLAGKIVAITLTSPLEVAREDVWRRGGILVNGLKVYDGKVFVTDSGSIVSIPIERDGRPGRARTLASRLSVFDDLLVDEHGIIAADFLGRKLLFFDHDGKLLRETAQVFDTPSSITRAKGPLVPEETLVVTEKGALNELTSHDGNRVSLFAP